MKKLLCVFCASMMLISGCSLRKDSDVIGNEKAESIAFEDAGVTDNDVSRKRTELDFDNGKQVYEIEFSTNDIQYSYHIDAVSGDIIEYEREDRPIQQQATSQPNSNSAQSENAVTEDAAKGIAIDHSGVTDPERYRSKIDYEDGRQVYEIEFYKDGYEYNYEIDCNTGEIVKYDSEKELF